jgi:predicted nucleic acid-binding OB-fold protein
MGKENRKKYMKVFDNVKKKYDDENKERLKERIVNEIKKEDDGNCNCKG